MRICRGATVVLLLILVVEWSVAVWPPIVCNSDSPLSCLCYSGDGSMSGRWPSCHSYIFQSSLAAVSLVVEANLFSQARPDGTQPETFLRQRLEPLLNKFCDLDAEKCVLTDLPIHPSMIFIVNVTPPNTDKNTDDSTAVQFVLLKSRLYRQIRDDTVMNSSLVADILKSQQSDLGKMLGSRQVRNLHVEKVSVVNGGHMVNGTSAFGMDQSGFFSTVTIVLGMIGLLLVIVYLVAIVKAVRDRSAMKERNRQRLARRKLTALSDDLVTKLPHNTPAGTTVGPSSGDEMIPEAISSYDNCTSSPPEPPPRHPVWKAAPKGCRRSLSTDFYTLLKSSSNEGTNRTRTHRSATSHNFPLALPDFFLKSRRQPSNDDVCLLETSRLTDATNSQPPDFPCPNPPTPPPVPPRRAPQPTVELNGSKTPTTVGLLTFDDFKWADPTIFTPIVDRQIESHLDRLAEEGSEDENENCGGVERDFNQKLLATPQVTIMFPSDTTENLVCPSVSSGSLASSSGSDVSVDSDSKPQNLQAIYEPLAESLWSLNK